MMLPRNFWAAVAALAPVAASLATDIEIGLQPELDLSVLTKHQSPHHPVSMRLPPTFNTSTPAHWIPTPGSWFLGTWYFTHSNQVQYQTWKNMQWTLSATANNSFDDTLNDLTSFQLFYGNDTTTVWNIYGIDTRTIINGAVQRDAYNFQPTGPYADKGFNIWEVIAWGYDSLGVPFAVLYETPAPVGQPTGAFDIISRRFDGPGEDTLESIYDAVKDLGNAELEALLKAAQKLKQTGARNGMKYPTCDALCKTNKINPYGF